MIKIKNIPTFLPLLESNELKAAQKSLEEKYLGPGKYVDNFEYSCSKILGVSHKNVCSVNTGFSAIHLVCLHLNIRKGDEVIMPSLTNVADAQVVISLGAKIVFCDILPETFCIDPNEIKKLITKKTKLIIPIDYGCNIAEHAEIKIISKRYEIPILHDAAHSFGSRYKNNKIGTIHDFTTFSFDPVKTLTTIDGGLIVSKNKFLKKTFKEMSMMGMKKINGVTTNVNRLGYRYHLANSHAAIGCEQIKKIDIIKANRLKYFDYYTKFINQNNKILLPKIFDHTDVLPFIYVARVKNRNLFRANMARQGIQTGMHWIPLHNFKYFRDRSRYKSLKITKTIEKEIVTLPLHSKMHKKDIVYIVKNINKFSK